MNVKNYLKYSSIIALFSEVIQFHYIIDLRLYYIIIIFNSMLLFLYKIKFNKNNILIIILLIIHGLLGVLIFKYPFSSLISQLIGITVSSIYFYNLLKYIDYRELFKEYVNFSFYVSVLGLIMFYAGITVWDPTRLHSILNEPSRFVIIVLPSVYFLFKEKKYFKFTIVLISLLLAQSSIGYIGLLFFLILPNLKIKIIKKLWLLIPLFIIAIFFLSKNEHFQKRYTQTVDSLRVFKTKKFEDRLNISSYALLSNAYVSYKNFISHPLGTGLGSYKSRHEYYINDLIIPRYILKLKMSKINSDDANSLFFRMTSDFGVFGIIAIFYFCFLCFKSYKFNSFEAVIAQSLVIYFFLKLLRQGHYFSQEFYFFLWVFIFAYKDAKTIIKFISK